MSKRIRLILIAVCALVASVCLLAGCNLKMTIQDAIDDCNQAGAVVDVTYFANEGIFEGGSRIKNMRFKAGSKPVDIANATFVSGGLKMGYVRINGYRYVIDKWYPAVLDDNGDPIIEDGTPEGKPVKITYDYEKTFNVAIKKPDSNDVYGVRYNPEKEFDFNTVLEKGVHYYIVATWSKVPSMNIKLAGDIDAIKCTGTKEVEVTENGETKTETLTTDLIFKRGELVADVEYSSSSGNAIPVAMFSTTFDGWTVDTDTMYGVRLDNEDKEIENLGKVTCVGFYTQPTCAENTLFDDDAVSYEDHKDDVDAYSLYARYILGEWTVVREPADVAKMFNAEGRFGYYVLKDIDCKNNVTVPAKIDYEGYNRTIKGNGKTISNFKVTASLSGNKQAASLFGEALKTCDVSDITFENVTQEYSLSRGTDVVNGIYFVFSGIDHGETEGGGAKFSNVVMSGTMRIIVAQNAEFDVNCTVSNLYNGNRAHWKFGGYNKDEDFDGGVTVNATVEIVKAEN